MSAGRAVPLLLLLASLGAGRPAAGQTLSGVVFVDRNGNGTRDPGEPGVAGVVVSDQIEVTKTNADGSFSLPRPAAGRADGIGGFVFVSVPSGFAPVGPSWRSVGLGSGEPIAVPLRPAAVPVTFTFIHASDIHVSPETVRRVERLRALVDSIGPALVLLTGDLIRDGLAVSEKEAAGYFELFAQEFGKLRVPLWTVPGNRDLFGLQQSPSQVSRENPLYARGMYRKYRGPDYYSFNFGGIHFVGLATADYAAEDYYGHVDSLQLAWLAKDLAQVPKSTPVVTFSHIPLFASGQALLGYIDAPGMSTAVTVQGATTLRHTVSNAGAVLALLADHLYPLALGGHFHLRERVRYEGVATRFDQAAAVVGPARPAGLVLPSGITVYRVRAGEIDDGRFVPLGLP